MGENNKPILKGMNIKPIVEERNSTNGRDGLNVKPLIEARAETQTSNQSQNNNQETKE